jgi:hypothetical protein
MRKFQYEDGYDILQHLGFYKPLSPFTHTQIHKLFCVHNDISTGINIGNCFEKKHIDH